MTAALHAFPSPEWVAAYGAAINASEDYRTASTEWTHGSVALVLPAQPTIGVPDDVAILLDLDRGTCRAAARLGRPCAAPLPLAQPARRGRTSPSCLQRSRFRARPRSPARSRAWETCRRCRPVRRVLISWRAREASAETIRKFSQSSHRRAGIDGGRQSVSHGLHF